jgi:hypothetical protein
VCRRVGVQDHDDVAIDAVDALVTQAEPSALDGQRTARRGPHHQDVLGARLVPDRERLVRPPNHLTAQIV